MNKKAVSLIVCGVLLVGGVFYWFSLRPSSIRSKCDRKARDFARIEGEVTFYANKYNPTYSACLHEHGI